MHTTVQCTNIASFVTDAQTFYRPWKPFEERFTLVNYHVNVLMLIVVLLLVRLSRNHGRLSALTAE